MYAIIKTGGKQYKVQEGDVIDIDLIQAEPKTALQFKEVLFLFDGTNSHVGAPCLKTCTVFADLIGECKGEKVIAFKYKRCKNYRRTVGHRQRYSQVKITRISAE